MRTGFASSRRGLTACFLAVALCVVSAWPALAITSNNHFASAVRVTSETAYTAVFESDAQTCTGLFGADNPVNMGDPSGHDFDLGSTMSAIGDALLISARNAGPAIMARVAAERTITKVAAIAVGATMTALYGYNELAGEPPNQGETLKINSAIGTMKQNGYVKAANRADSLRYRKVDLDGEAWGYTPYFAVRTIWLDPGAFTLDDLLFASLVMHETTHTLQYPLRSEYGAYQAQSDFLISVGISGTVDQVSTRFPSDSSFIDDIADGMRQYQVIKPAITK